MKCPYECKSKTEIETWEQTVEDGHPTKGKTMRQFIFELEECKKEECGAWYDGRCHYKEG